MKTQTKTILQVVLCSLLVIALIVFGPLAIIFALNNLFPVLVIPYTFWTWISVCILNLTILYKPTVQKVKLA